MSAGTITALVQRMKAAGATPEMLADVLETLAGILDGAWMSGGIPVDHAAEKRRAYDRERKAKARCVSGGKSGGIPPEFRNQPSSPPDGPPLSPAPLSPPLNPPTPSADTGRKRAIALPASWSVGEKGHAFAKQHGMSAVEISEEADRFRSHHEARGSTMKDWDAAWRTWVMSPYRQKGGRGPPPRQSKPSWSDLARHYAEEERNGQSAHHAPNEPAASRGDGRGARDRPSLFEPDRMGHEPAGPVIDAEFSRAEH